MLTRIFCIASTINRKCVHLFKLTEALPHAVVRVTRPARTTEAAAGGEVSVRALS